MLVRICKGERMGVTEGRVGCKRERTVELWREVSIWEYM